MTLKNSEEESVWPPIVGDCPDYWVDLSGNGAACFNSKSLGRCNIPGTSGKNTMDFTTQAFTSENSMCAKYKLAKACDVTWDGITYGINNPCATTSS